MTRRTIKVEQLARVEGEGALHLAIEGRRVTDVRLEIFEPPRFFEAFLQGRRFTEAPDITARICGICPVAYQMSTVHALEAACGVIVDGPLRDLRRLLYCGEWLESHALHVFMLHAPDFLGYQDAIRMAADHPGIVQRGLRLKKLGNAILEHVGGRAVHPVNVRVGGFHRAPPASELAELVPELEWGRQAALETVRWTATLPCPDFETDYEFVALRHPHEYPFNEGRIATSRGGDLDVTEYADHFREEHVPHTTALHSTLDGRTYFVGPMARFALNFDRLPGSVQAAADEVGLAAPCRNPFRSIVVRSLELLFACEEALRVIRDWVPPAVAAVPVPPRAGSGCAATEAPRGLLYHRFELDAEGLITHARIVPPTSQNQRAIEADLAGFVERHLDLGDDELTWQCEQAVRNYDPCISCATHFLKLDVQRR